MKSLLTLLFVCLAGSIYAQSTLTAANLNPQAGETFVYYNQSSPFPAPGSGGANVTWDYHTLQSQNTDTSTYIACSSTPGCGMFSGSNIATVISGGFIYYTADSGNLVLNGGYESGVYGDTIIYNGDTLLKYPFTYNSSFTGHYTAIDNNAYIGISHDTGMQTVTCDGYGTLILPTGTFQNVLRVHALQQEVDVTNGVFNVLYNRYYWYMPGYHIPLLEIEYYYTLETNQKDTIIGYTAQLTGATAVNNINLETAFELYPNPVQQTLYIKFTVPEKQMISVTISDMLGREAAPATSEMYDQGSHQLTYNTSRLPKGMYLVRLQSSTGAITRKIEVM